LCNGWSKVDWRYVIYKAGRWALEQELGLRQESKVLELPQQTLGTRKTRGNQSIKESI
jgi:hypothetical protein